MSTVWISRVGALFMAMLIGLTPIPSAEAEVETSDALEEVYEERYVQEEEQEPTPPNEHLYSFDQVLHSSVRPDWALIQPKSKLYLLFHSLKLFD